MFITALENFFYVSAIPKLCITVWMLRSMKSLTSIRICDMLFLFEDCYLWNGGRGGLFSCYILISICLPCVGICVVFQRILRYVCMQRPLSRTDLTTFFFSKISPFLQITLKSTNHINIYNFKRYIQFIGQSVYQQNPFNFFFFQTS